MSKAFRRWKAARLGAIPLRVGPLPKKLFTMRNYRASRRHLQAYNKWTRKTTRDIMSKSDFQIMLRKEMRGDYDFSN